VKGSIGISDDGAIVTSVLTQQGDKWIASSQSHIAGASIAPPKVKMLKKSKLTTKAKLHVEGAPAPVSFAIIDNEDDTVTVSGVDAAGDMIDISAVATLDTPVSSDPTMVTADAPVGMTFKEHAIVVGSPTVTVTATWNDGSLGPFSYTDNLTITAPPSPGPVTGLVITHGTPVIRLV
jgi:hypothetical protein